MGKVININNNMNKNTKKGQENDPVMLLRATSEFYRLTSEIAGNYAIVAEEILRKEVAPAIHMSPSKFHMDIEDMLSFTETLKEGAMPCAYFYAVEGNSEYCVMIALSEDDNNTDLFYTFQVNKYENGLYYIFNFETKEWDKEEYQEISEKMKKILDSGSPETDILEEILTFAGETVNDSAYQSIKSKYKGLFALYNKTCQYMQPYFEPDDSGKGGNLYLKPRDPFRYGFLVGWEGAEYVLYQYLDPLEIDGKQVFEDFTFELDLPEPYMHESGRTSSLATIKKTLKNMADRFIESETFTIPLSMEAVTEASRLKHIGRNLYFYCKRRKLSEEEQQALDAVKKAVRKFPISY